MLCAPLDWQYAELPSSASDAVLCVYVRCGSSNKIKNSLVENREEIAKDLLKETVLFVAFEEKCYCISQHGKT